MARDLGTYQVAEGVFALRDRLSHTLAQVVAAFERDGIPLPSRQLYTLNRPTVDCEQVAVSYLQGYLGPPGDQGSTPQQCSEPRTVMVEVSISRKWPTVAQGSNQVPSADSIMKASDWALVDTWELLNNLDAISSEPDGYTRSGVIATVNTDRPEGGYITTRLNLTFSVYGTS